MSANPEVLATWFVEVVGKNTVTYRDNNVYSISFIFLFIAAGITFAIYIPTCIVHFLLYRNKTPCFKYTMLTLRYVSGILASVMFGMFLGLSSIMSTWGTWYWGFILLFLFWVACLIHGIRWSDEKDESLLRGEKTFDTRSKKLENDLKEYPSAVLNGIKRFYGVWLISGLIFILVVISVFVGTSCNFCVAYYPHTLSTTYTRKVLGAEKVCGKLLERNHDEIRLEQNMLYIFDCT